MMVLIFVLSQCLIVKLLTKPILLRIFYYCNLNNEIPIFEARVVNFSKSFSIENDMSIR